MTGVIEVVAGAAAFAAVAHSRHEGVRQEESVALELYQSFFHADLLERSPDKPRTLAAAGLPAELNAHAAASIRVIERYQKERRRWFLGFSSSAPVSDTRTRVLEEMKDWLMTVSDGAVTVPVVSSRLEYCWQYLLRPSVFPTSNETSFLGTLAEVCKQLESLLKQAIASQRTGVEQIGRILSVGLELAHGTLPVLLVALLEEAAIPGRGEGAAGGQRHSSSSAPQEPPGVAALLAAVAEETAGDGSGSGGPSHSHRPKDWATDVGRILRALLCTEHFRRLGASDDDTAQTSPVGAAPDSENAAAALTRTLEESQAGWVDAEPGVDSGLLEAFRRPAQREARSAYLDLCRHLDRSVFFLAALRPYRQLVAAAGDVAMCWLRKGLGHLLQELERALVQLRQARLEVLCAAKRHLQEVAKRLPAASPAEIRWAQGLRYIDELHLDVLHRAIAAECADVRAAAAVAREAELHVAARQGLCDVISGFMSADFQSRCALALPDRLVADMKGLALAAEVAEPAEELPGRAATSGVAPCP